MKLTQVWLPADVATDLKSAGFNKRVHVVCRIGQGFEGYYCGDVGTDIRYVHETKTLEVCMSRKGEDKDDLIRAFSKIMDTSPSDPVDMVGDRQKYMWVSKS